MEPVGEDVGVRDVLGLRRHGDRVAAAAALEGEPDPVRQARVDVAGERDAPDGQLVAGRLEVLEPGLDQEVLVGHGQQLGGHVRADAECVGVGLEPVADAAHREVAGQQRRLEQPGEGGPALVHQRPGGDPVPEVHHRPGLRRSPVEDVAHGLGQRGVVGVVGVDAGPDVGDQVELEDLAVPGLEHRAAALGADQPGDLVDGQQPVVQVVLARLLLGDRGAVAARPPAVDDVGQDVEGGRGQVGAGDRHLVLVAHPDRELQARRLDELAAEHLGAREDVGQRLGHVGERDSRARNLVEPARPRLLDVRRLVLLPLEGAHGEVGAAPHQRTHVVGQRGLGERVVGVDEGDQVAAGLADAGVAGGAEAGVLLPDDPHPVVGRRVPGDDVHRPVRRAVVDDHDLEVRVGLAQDRGQALVDVLLDGVDRHDHADQGVPGPPVGAVVPGRRRLRGPRGPRGLVGPGVGAGSSARRRSRDASLPASRRGARASSTRAPPIHRSRPWSAP